MDIPYDLQPADIHRPDDLCLWFADEGPEPFEVERCDASGCRVCAGAAPRPIPEDLDAPILVRAA